MAPKKFSDFSAAPAVVRWLLPVLSLLFASAAVAQPVADQSGEQQRKPAVVYFHADWCSNCKVLGPRFIEASRGFDSQLRLLIVDYTNEETLRASQLKALELGLFELVSQNRHTGYAVLLNDDGSERQRIFRTLETDQIRQRLSQFAQSES